MKYQDLMALCLSMNTLYACSFDDILELYSKENSSRDTQEQISPPPYTATHYVHGVQSTFDQQWDSTLLDQELQSLLTSEALAHIQEPSFSEDPLSCLNDVMDTSYDTEVPHDTETVHLEESAHIQDPLAPEGQFSSLGDVMETSHNTEVIHDTETVHEESIELESDHIWHTWHPRNIHAQCQQTTGTEQQKPFQIIQVTAKKVLADATQKKRTVQSKQIPPSPPIPLEKMQTDWALPQKTINAYKIPQSGPKKTIQKKTGGRQKKSFHIINVTAQEILAKSIPTARTVKRR